MKHGLRAGVLMALIDVQADQAPLSQLIIGLISAEAAKSTAAAAADKGPAAGQLPSEAQPLLRLLAHAQRVLSMLHTIDGATSADKAPFRGDPSALTDTLKRGSNGRASRHTLQKRKRNSVSQDALASGREDMSGDTAAAGTGSLEDGLSKKLRLAPSIDIRCTEGPWASELQMLADQVANTG